MTLNHKSIEEAYNLINKKIIKTPLVSNDYINNLLNSEKENSGPSTVLLFTE